MRYPHPCRRMPLTKKETVVTGADIIKAIKLAEAEHMKPKKESRWCPTAWVNEVKHGSERIKNYFIGVKVKF
jgi:hypothetical protein